MEHPERLLILVSIWIIYLLVRNTLSGVYPDKDKEKGHTHDRG